MAKAQIDLMAVGGGSKVKYGTFTPVSGSVVTINDVGFKASKIIIYNLPTTTVSGNVQWPTASVIFFYDKDYAEGNQYRAYYSGSANNCNTVPMPNTLSDSMGITDISSSGFSFRGTSPYTNLMNYIAIE